jgi:hypothetical protein
MGKTDMTESTGRTFSCPARRSPRPTAIQTTLYDLIVALSAEVPPDEDDLLNAWCELAKSLKSKGGFTDTQTESRLVQRITSLFSMTASQQLTPSV